MMIKNSICFIRICIGGKNNIPYFFGYKTEVFFFQSNPKNLDPSYKIDLDFWDCLGRVKLVLHTCDKFQIGMREVFLSFPGGF